MAQHQQWEYCELVWDGWERGRHGDYYNVIVYYYSPGKYVRYELASTEKKQRKAFQYNPFRYAIRLLGAVGWELVSYQVATGGSSSGFGFYASFYWGKRIAIFKRPVQPNRPVDEPKLTELVIPGALPTE